MSVIGAIANFAMDSISSMCNSALGITNEGSLNTTLEGDWSYIFMPEPIAGGTTNIEEMYNDN